MVARATLGERLHLMVLVVPPCRIRSPITRLLKVFVTCTFQNAYIEQTLIFVLLSQQVISEFHTHIIDILYFIFCSFQGFYENLDACYFYFDD